MTQPGAGTARVLSVLMCTTPAGAPQAWGTATEQPDGSWRVELWSATAKDQDGQDAQVWSGTARQDG